MSYSYRRRRSGPNWGVVFSVVLIVGTGIYFVPRYLNPRPGPPPGADGPAPAPVSASASAAPSPSTDVATARLAEGDRSMAGGRWGAAAAAYAEAARAEPTRGLPLARWAQALVFANKPREAVEQAQKAVDLEPRVSLYQAILSLAQDWAGNPDRAIIAGRRAVELDPTLPAANAYLAEAFTDKYRLPEAQEALDKAMQAPGGKDDPEVLRVQAYLQETKADYSAAAATYRKAIERAPERSYLYLSLGHALRALKEYDNAIQAFQKAADLNPQDARAEGGLGMVYYALEEYDSAQSHLERAIEVDPSYASGYGQLGWVFYVQKQYDRARPNFERAIELEQDPLRNAAYRHALGWIYLSMKQPDQARQQFTKALELNPQLEGAKEGLQVLDGQGSAGAAAPTPSAR